MPVFKDLFSDVLTVLSGVEVLHRRELAEAVVARLDLTDDERAETLHGGGNRVASRVHWATEYLVQSEAVARPRRGILQITDFGRTLLAEQPEGVTLARLQQTKGLQAWTERSREARKSRRGEEEQESESTLEANSALTPGELIELGVERFNESIASELLDRLRTEGWLFFEHAVLRVLHALGYGQGEEDVLHLGQSGDGGVDGLINQDRLGLDQIYVQAKCYRDGNNLNESVIREFVGAVTGKRATRGVFITTSSFTKGARELVAGIPQPRIVLIDGDELTQLMIAYEVGVTVEQEIKVYKLDQNFFEA